MSYDLTNPAKPKITKDPNAVLDYSIDLADWLTEVSDTLSTVTATGVGVTVDSAVVSGTKCVAWVSGGTAGGTATVTFHYTTTGGRTDDRTLYFKLKDR